MGIGALGNDFIVTAASGGERVRVTSAGHVRVNTGDLRVGDDTDSNAGSQTISVGSVSSGSGGIGIFANPTNGKRWVQFGDGTSGSDQYRGYMNYQHADDSLRFGTAAFRKLRITSAGNLGIGGLTNPGALLSIPAGESNTPRLAIESAVDDNDFTITQYEDGNGTYTMLGQNVKLNSGGNNTILDSAHRTAGILLDARNHGSIVFLTGGTNAVGENLKIDDDGRVLVGPGAIATPKCGHAGIDIPNNDWAIIMGGSDGNGNRANNANKDGRFAGAHYVNAEEPVGIIRCTSGSSANELHMGGGTSLVNAATQISLYTAANTTTTGGTERLRIDSAGRLLHGTTSSSSNISCFVFQGNSDNSASAAGILLQRGTATPPDGQELGNIYFADSGGGTGAIILGKRDGGTWRDHSNPNNRVLDYF